MMPDERKDSIEQGIGAPDESPTGKEADRKRREQEGPEVGGGMGGTSDASRPGDEAARRAAEEAGEE